jgi:CPA2 family monovalent cation:H+ antiporter-2
VLGKSIAAYGIVRLFGHPNATALTIAASLAQIGEFSFILVGLGVSLQILPPLARDVILAGALLSIMLNPLLFVALSRWRRRQDAADPAAEPAPGPALPVEGHTLVFGYGRVGSQLARLLRDAGHGVVVMDNDGDLVGQAHADGFPAVRGNAASEERLRELHPEGARSALLAIPQALEAGEVINRLRIANPAMTILARAHSEEEMHHLVREGADGAVLAEREMAYSMAEMLARARAG